VVFHLAGLPGSAPVMGDQFTSYLTVTCSARQRLMEACRGAEVPRLVTGGP